MMLDVCYCIEYSKQKKTSKKTIKILEPGKV